MKSIYQIVLRKIRGTLLNMNEPELIIKTILEAKNKYSYPRNYRLNIIDELHANENAHTRILLKLLQYKGEDRIFLKKFIDLLNSELEKEQQIELKNEVSICGQHDFIDGYIEDTKKDWAIIIENKINNAPDQPKQIENYLKKTIKNKKINKKNIYVVYLTDTGNKKIEDYSLTSKAKGILDYNNIFDTGRFIELNYKYHILSDLLEEVSSIPKEEKLLLSSILQYKDYLNRRFYKNEKDEFTMKMNAELKKILDIPKDLTCMRQIELLEEKKNEVIKILEDYKEELYPPECRADFIINEITKDYKGDKNFSEVKCRENYTQLYIRVNQFKNREKDLRVGIVFDDYNEELPVYFTCAICEKNKWKQISTEDESKELLGINKNNKKENFIFNWIGGTNNNYFHTEAILALSERCKPKCKEKIEEKFSDFIEVLLK